MTLPIFKLENYFARWEFTALHSLCFSDTETWGLDELLSLADSECKKLWDTLRLGYTHTQGSPLLRQEIAKLYNCPPDSVVCTAGAEEGIFAALHALIKPGEHVVIVKPCYESLANIPESLGAEISELFLDAQNGWKLDMDQLKNTLRPDTKLLVLNYPHSPTGAILTAQEQQEIVDLARKNGTYIFCDEVYRLLEFAPDTTLPSFSACYEKAVSLSVMSKAYGLAGLRIGWLVSQDAEVLQRIKDVKHYLSICNSAPSESLALIALRNGNRIITRNLQIIRDNLARLIPFLERQSDLFSWHEPGAGCTGLVKLKRGESCDTFIQNLIQKAGILLLPGAVYGCPDTFRVGFARKNFPEVLSLFEEYLHANYR